ncbi:unnamed protein product [Agarophyton chilense]
MGNTPSKSPEAVAELLVEKTILGNNVVIFSKRNCGYCDAAKRALSTATRRLVKEGCDVPKAAVIELDDGSVSPEIAREIQSILMKMTGASTVPRVFLNQTFLGGASETLQYAQGGGLHFALMKAGKCGIDAFDANESYGKA